MSVLVYLRCAQLGGSWTARSRFAPARLGRAVGPVSPIGTLVLLPQGSHVSCINPRGGQGVSPDLGLTLHPTPLLGVAIETTRGDASTSPSPVLRPPAGSSRTQANDRAGDGNKRLGWGRAWPGMKGALGGGHPGAR